MPERGGGNSNILSKYVSDVGRASLLSREEEVALAKRAQNGDQEARKTLIESNLRFVISVAKEYYYKKQ